MTPSARSILLNGEMRQVESSTIDQLVEDLGIPGATLLIEYNGAALRRDEWKNQALSEGDRIELLRIAAGG